jgi:hypothetical protein
MLEVDVGGLMEQFPEFLKPSCIGTAKILDAEGKVRRNDTRRSVADANISRLDNIHSIR